MRYQQINKNHLKEYLDNFNLNLVLKTIQNFIRDEIKIKTHN